MIDFLLDSDLDLKIINGDLVAGVSDGQHQELLLLTGKGDWKGFPTVGVGLFSFLNDEDPQLMFREIRLQFSNDGLQISAINIKDGQIQIDANYL